MPNYLTHKQVEETMSNVYNFLDKINLEEYLNIYKNKDLRDMMDKLEEDFPYNDKYSETLFDCIAIDEFIDYLQKRYLKLDIQESVVTTYYIR